MPELKWSDSFALDIALMDETHQEFIDQLHEVQQASDAHLLSKWQALVDHTDAHFSREDDWMKKTGFAGENCHSMQHQMVLKVMQEGARRGEAGDLSIIRQMAEELTVWFPHHAQVVDAGLAQHLRLVGFDPETGNIANPHALPNDEIHGCTGISCADSPEEKQTA